MTARKVRTFVMGFPKQNPSLVYMHNISLQDHICRLTGDYLPGLDCLSDGQIVSLLLAMDPESLLDCGRASPRLYRLVCDREVWCHLLKGVEFTKEHMEDLRLFGLGLFGISGSPEMMSEVVKEAARRFPLVQNVKLTITIQSWGNPDTVEVDGENLEDLTKVSQAVGAKFTITEVQDLETHITGGLLSHQSTFRLIAAHLAQQKERLSKLELTKVNLSLPGAHDLFFNLQRACIKWSVQNLILYKRKDCETLARNAATGSINTLHLRVNYRLPRARWQDDVKRVWKITDKVVFRLMMSDTPDIEISGGKGEDSEADWQMLQVVFDA